MSNCSSRGGGTREREIISQVNRNAFKHKQMKYLRSQIMAEMDVEISIIPLCILMGNICQACMVGEDRGFQGIAFFHLQDLKDFIPPWFWQPAFPSCWSLWCPKPGRSIQMGCGCKESLRPLSDGTSPVQPTRAILNGNQFCRSRKIHLTTHKGFTKA